MYRGHGADLSDVLFVTLRTGRTTWGSPAVPEGVVVLQWMFTYTWTYCLCGQTGGGTGTDRERKNSVIPNQRMDGCVQ